MKVFVVVPVFNEQKYLPRFIAAWEEVSYYSVTVIVANGNPGDETSDWIAQYDGRLRIDEVRGNSGLYWSGLVSLGLSKVSRCSDGDAVVVLTNIDIYFQRDPLSVMLKKMRAGCKLQIAAMVQNQAGVLLSAGVVVKSWGLSQNEHLLAGEVAAKVPPQFLAATYLPTRFLMFPAKAVREVGLPNQKHLPHYCADYEYSNRLRLYGYLPYVDTESLVENLEDNTGFKTFDQPTKLVERLNKCLEMKCTYNLIHRFWFVMLVYPGWTRVPGLLTHFVKIGVEIMIGGIRLRKMIK